MGCFLQLVHEEILFGGDRHWPKLQHRCYNIVCETWVLLDILGHVAGQLFGAKRLKVSPCAAELEPRVQDSRLGARFIFTSLDRKSLCSSLRGRTNPLMILPRISSNSPTLLCISHS